VLWWRRQRLESLALLGGLVLTYAGVHITKAATDRPRPLDPLIDAAGSAYPSGHAAYAVCWVAIAIALRHAFPRVRTRAGVLVAGILIAAAVGLTRVYLRVHWFSDVAGGWGVAAMCFATAGMAALVIGFFARGGGRETEGGGDAPGDAAAVSAR
jgi:undecaprenyl-diphosphatase